MQFERLGVIVFFGILVPGAYLTASLLLAFACVLELTGIHGHSEIFSFFSRNLALSASGFLFLSYLLGMVVRLFAPNAVDKLSTYYLIFTRFRSRKEEKNDWIYDVFPYQNSIARHMEKQGLSKVTTFIESLNREYGRLRNTTFFGYCKLIIEANNEAIARNIQQAEAMVRFLSGACLALIVSALLDLFFSVSFWFRDQVLFEIYLGITLVSLLTLAGILGRFKHQRRREVLLVWEGIYLLLKGGIPNNLNISPNELRDRVSLEGGAI
jgi:hypothetical protein